MKTIWHLIMLWIMINVAVVLVMMPTVEEADEP